MLVEQALTQAISLSGSVCSAAAESPWLVNLHLSCNLSEEALVGLIVLPVASLLLAFDLMAGWLRGRAKSRDFARRLQVTYQNERRAQARDGSRWGQPEAMYPAPSMFPPLRAMKSV